MSNVLTSLADVILEYLLFGTAAAVVLVPLAWALIKAGKIRAHVYRHMIWLYSLIGVALLPVIWLHGPKLKLAVLTTPAELTKGTSLVETNINDTITYNRLLPTEPTTPRPSHEEMAREANTNVRAFSVKAAFAGVWLVGFVFMLSRLGVGWYRLRRICSRATPVPQCEYFRDTNGREIKVLLTSQLCGPVCFGVIRPVVMLPREMYDKSLAKDIQMVLTHELAHIKRRDCWTNFFQRTIESVFFFHPLVWLASRQLTQQREQICDNYVLAKGASADDYTMLLSQIGERAFRRTSLQTVALYEGQLLSRVRSLLDPLHSLETKVPRWAAITCTFVVLLGFFVFSSVRLGAKPISKALAGQDTERMDTGQALVVHFPSERSVGRVFIQDVGRIRKITDFFHWGDPTEWEYLCEAKGEVHVPAGKRLSLAVNQTARRDLSWLSHLRPDDLYKLGFTPSSGSLQNTFRLTNGHMRHIAHLTGLKSLSLKWAVISDKDMEYIRYLKSLEYIEPPSRLTDGCLALIAEIPTLKGLYLFVKQGSSITNKSLRHLSNLTSLEELYISGDRIGDAGLIHLRGLPNLQYILLCSSRFTDDGLVHLKEIPSLRVLSLLEGLCQITDAGLVHISNMHNLENLYLDVQGPITDDGLANLTKMRSLKKLHFGSSQITDRGLAYLGRIKTLEQLDLPQEQEGITDTGLAYLAELPNLRHLAITRIHFIDPKMNKEYYTDKGLAELAKCRLLEELYIGSPGITDEGMRHVARLTNLKKLMLFGCENVTNEGLAQLTTLKSLRDLYITKSKITIGGLTHLNKIPGLYKLDLFDIEQDHAGLNISGLTNLEELGLNLKIERVDRENNVLITQKSTAADLACLAKLKRLRWLQGINGVTDASLKQLAGLTNMERLGFAATGLTDDGLKCLANMKNLDLLHINNKYPAKASGAGGRILTDEGLRYLEGLKMLTYLQIDSDNNFSAAAIQRLSRGLPNLYALNINGSNGQPTGMGARASAPGQPQRPTLAGRRPARSRTARQNRTRPTRQY
ncbi:MAG: hypothetical protein OEW48_08605 [Phycisphaerae bacterium]|nr:hypothetical protein [Phycisphaerae bacterium]